MKKFFEGDTFLLLASLFLAVLIWFAIRQVTSYEETFYDIDLVIRQDKGWAVEDVSSDTFQITFQGSREDISRLKVESIRVELDLRGQEKDQHVLALRPKNIIFPGVARVSAIFPDMVSVRMDQEVEKSVPVKPAFSGSPSPGCLREADSVQPPAVTLRGSRKQLDLIASLQTGPIDLTGRSESFETHVAVLPPAGSWVKRIEPNRVLVQVRIVTTAAPAEEAPKGLPDAGRNGKEPGP